MTTLSALQTTQRRRSVRNRIRMMWEESDLIYDLIDLEEILKTSRDVDEDCRLSVVNIFFGLPQGI